MNSRELVYATLDFQCPPRVPRDLWALPASFIGREAPLKALLDLHPLDIAAAENQTAFAVTGTFDVGRYTDPWGSEWRVLQQGMLGEVTRGALNDYARISEYTFPIAAADHGWESTAASIAAQREKFILSGWNNPWERMQFLRGTENLFADLSDPDIEEIYLLRDGVFAFYRAMVERWVTFDIDAVVFGDDWGSQRGLLISPAKWREFFRPKYQELFDIVLDAGKRIFFHSDGDIRAILPDLLAMGVNALNSQVWCMGLQSLASYAGKITFWGELDRQQTLTTGTPSDVCQAATQMVKALHRNGGLIGQCAIDQLTPLENIEAGLTAWNQAFETLVSL